MNIPAEVLKESRTAPKDRPFLLYSPVYAPSQRFSGEIVELVEWTESVKGFLATGLSNQIENNGDLEPDQIDLIEDEKWRENCPRPWFWCDLGDLAP